MKRLPHFICCGVLAVIFAACSGQKSLPVTEIVSHAPGNVSEFAAAIETGYAEVKELESSFKADTSSFPADTVRKKIVSVHKQLMKQYPVYYDWWLQDGDFSQVPAQWQEEYTQYGKTPGINWFARPLEEELNLRLNKLASPVDGSSIEAGTFVEKMELYTGLCIIRREERLLRFLQDSPQVLFTKFEVLRPSFFAYTEGQSDARTERNFFPGSELSLLRMDGIWGAEETLLRDSLGVFRDPDIHFDGRDAVFAWKKSMLEDDFHLYEMNLTSRKVKQLTKGLGYADIEPVYLPDDNIMFNSTRCGTAVDCWTTEVSNLYVCDRKGRYMRRVGFDQVHTPHPAVLDDGRVVYTRWDYNDRGQIWTQPLFQMNPDGTGQAEYYGLNSWFPTTPHGASNTGHP